MVEKSALKAVDTVCDVVIEVSENGLSIQDLMDSMDGMEVPLLNSIEIVLSMVIVAVRHKRELAE